MCAGNYLILCFYFQGIIVTPLLLLVLVSSTIAVGRKGEFQVKEVPDNQKGLFFV